MAKKIIVHTGEKVPVSGEYHPSGGKSEWTMVRGKIVPPNTEGDRQKFTLIHKAKHEKKK
jgi:hypothetical protein